MSKELVDFLNYLEHTTDETGTRTESERIRRIHQRVCKVRASEEIGVKYMQEWEEKYYAKQEAREEGLKEGLLEGLQKGKEERDRELVQKNLKKGRSILEIADLLDESPEYIEKLV